MTPPGTRRSSLHIILVAAVIQGWGLYGLSWAADHDTWPAMNSGLLMALYALFVVTPLTLQFLVEHSSQRLTWLLSAGVGLAFMFFGWHFGHFVSNEPGEGFFKRGAAAEHIVTGLVLWLLVLPFLQVRLVTGKWWPRYSVLFAHASRNLFTLAEASLFTGLFWMLLFTWGALFRMLGMPFFAILFEEEIFAIPVTWLTFGVALHLITGMDRLTSVLLQQLLNVLKWLTLVAVLILALFSVALAFKLPGLITTGNRAIQAESLLWLTAIIVLLFNAAYRDGETDQPYPRVIGLVLRALVPLTLVVVITAAWSLQVRTNQYGLTVERVWGWVVTVAAVAFAVGYSISAVRKGKWMQGIERVNVIVVLALIAIIAAALTPVLSPYRLAAGSQFRRVIAGPVQVATKKDRWREDSFHTLRFSAGEYGRARLKALASVQQGPKAEQTRNRAQLVLGKDFKRFESTIDYTESLNALRVYPAGRSLTPELRAALVPAVREHSHHGYLAKEESTAGLFIDLNGDQKEDFALIAPLHTMVFEQTDGLWKQAIEFDMGVECSHQIHADLQSGRFEARPPRWADLTIGARRYQAAPPAKCP